jgi:hypothetical protein
MGGFLKVLGAIALVVIVLVGALFAYGWVVAVPLIKSAGAYTDDAVQAIAKSWDSEELVKRAAPDLKAALTPDVLQSNFAQFAALGPLVKYKGSVCNVARSVTTASGSAELLVGCTATAACQNADARFDVALLRVGQSWQIEGLVISKAPSGAAMQPPSFGFGISTGSAPTPRGLRIPLKALNWLAFHDRRAP